MPSLQAPQTSNFAAQTNNAPQFYEQKCESPEKTQKSIKSRTFKTEKFKRVTSVNSFAQFLQTTTLQSSFASYPLVFSKHHLAPCWGTWWCLMEFRCGSKLSDDHSLPCWRRRHYVVRSVTPGRISVSELLSSAEHQICWSKIQQQNFGVVKQTKLAYQSTWQGEKKPIAWI